MGYWTWGLVSTRQGLRPKVPDSSPCFQCVGELRPSNSSSLLLREVFRFILRFFSLEDKLNHKSLASSFPTLLSSTCIYTRNWGEITVFWLHFYRSRSIVYSVSFLQSLVYPGVNGHPIFGASWFFTYLSSVYSQVHLEVSCSQGSQTGPVAPLHRCPLEKALCSHPAPSFLAACCGDSVLVVASHTPLLTACLHWVPPFLNPIPGL